MVAIDRLDLVVEPWTWPFAIERRADIDAHFAARQTTVPDLWNGRVLLMHRFRLAHGLFAGAWFETDFASFLAWRDWGCPDESVANGFAMGALRAADGAFLLGVMGDGTANAGRVYFPAGTPDPHDVVDGRLDLAGSVLREVAEETGLTVADFSVAPSWHAVVSGPRIAMMRILQCREDAVTLRARILAHLATEASPELADIRIVRAPADLDDAMPAFVTAFLRNLWRNPSC